MQVQSLVKNFFDRQIVDRVVGLAVGVRDVALSALRTVVGVGASVADLVWSTNVTEHYREGTKSSAFIVSSLMRGMLLTIHPRCKTYIGEGNFPDNGRGLFTNVVWHKFEQRANRYLEQNRPTAARLTYAALLLVSIVSRIADGIIGSLAYACALVTLGRSRLINTIALKGLEAPGIVMDLFRSLREIKHPEMVELY